jgi:hypothetical protein
LRQIDEFCEKEIGLIWEILALDLMILMFADSGSATIIPLRGGKELLLV